MSNTSSWDGLSPRELLLQLIEDVRDLGTKLDQKADSVEVRMLSERLMNMESVGSQGFQQFSRRIDSEIETLQKQAAKVEARNPDQLVREHRQLQHDFGEIDRRVQKNVARLASFEAVANERKWLFAAVTTLIATISGVVGVIVSHLFS